VMQHTALWSVRRGYAFDPVGDGTRSSWPLLNTLNSSVQHASTLFESLSRLATTSVRTARATSDARGGGGAAAATYYMQVGDTLLFEAAADFEDGHRYGGRIFVMVSRVANSMPPRELALGDRLRLLACMLALLTLLGVSSLADVELFALVILLCYVLIGINCLTLEQAWRCVNVPVLLTIAASFGVGNALDAQHVSALVASFLGEVSQSAGPVGFLLVVFFLTAFLSCVINNAATVVLLYSVLRAVRLDDLEPAQSLLVLMMGASAAFATPIGYQTNLMVMARGGYRFSDFILLGGTLTITVGTVICLLVYALPVSLLPATIEGAGARAPAPSPPMPP